MKNVIDELVSLQYERNDIEFTRGKFRVRGDILDVFPVANQDEAVRLEFFGDEIDRICIIEPISGKVKSVSKHEFIYPKSHYVIPKEKLTVQLKESEKNLMKE